jgi:co-chaperonin GroES (HSP10)
MALPSLLNNWVLVEMPKDYGTYDTKLRRARVAAVSPSQSSTPPIVGDTVTFNEPDASQFHVDGGTYLAIKRADLIGVEPAPRATARS